MPKTVVMTLSGFLVRLIVLAAGAVVLAGGALTFAADRVASPSAVSGTPKAQTLVVPQVEGQVYVFAKGILEEAGFGWQVDGAVRGYAANVVRRQFPSAGTVVANTGAPMIRLTLERNPKYREQGTPEDASPYPATVVLLPDNQSDPRPRRPRTR